MSIETELKLRLRPEHLLRLRRHALLKRQQIAPPSTRHLHNIYFDTPDLALHGNEMALRLRRVGGRWLQTLKGGGTVQAGLHQRNEWEVPVASNALDLAALDAAIWDACLPAAQRAQLRPVFVTDFYRTTRLLSWQDATIEVCMDRGEVRAGQDCAPICEVELELKSGQPNALFGLALAILDIVPFELEAVSKAELGFRLLSGYVAHPAKAELADMQRAGSLAAGLQAQIWACLSHLQRNLPAGQDAEYLHQIRVALRRLRVLLRVVEKLHPDAALARLRHEVAEACILLGELREWDVFVEGLLTLPQQSETDFSPLLLKSEARRAACYASLHQHDQRLQRLMLHCSLWMHGAYWGEAEKIAPPRREFATRHLQKLARRLSAYSQQPDKLNAAQRHALRITVKKLRYSVEFFAALFEHKAVRAYLAALCELQEQLGLGNDLTVACRLLDGLAHDVALQPQQALIAAIRAQLKRDLSGEAARLQSALARLNGVPVFW